MANIAVTTLTELRYAQTFEVFLRRSREYPLIVDHLSEIAKKRQTIHLLDVGAGTGEPIKGLLNKTTVEVDFYLAIEPNQNHAKILKKRMNAHGLRSFDVLSKTFDSELELSRSFDISLFCHSLYGMSDPADCFLHSLNFLKPGGLSLAYIQGPHGPYSLYRFFNRQFMRDVPSPENGMSSHELVMALRAKGMMPTTETLPTSIDMTGLFEPQNRAELEEFVSFCLLVEFNELPASNQLDIIEFMHSGCVSMSSGLIWHAPTIAVSLTRFAR